MDAEAAEHVREAVPVLSRYADALALRAFGAGVSWAEDRQEPLLSAFRRLSSVPVVNLESPTAHPLQGLADLLTIRERMDPKGKNFLLAWVPHVRCLPPAVAHTAAEIASLAGMNVRILRPRGFDLDPEVLERVRAACAERRARFEITDDAENAYAGVHVVYAKSWGSLERYGEPPPREASFRARWIVDEEKMGRTDGAIFMHCLPLRRNLEVTDAVVDSPASVVLDQAGNRLPTAEAVLLSLFAPAEA
jgi:N-acetylornithine carbamoyltransferase